MADFVVSHLLADTTFIEPCFITPALQELHWQSFLASLAISNLKYFRDIYIGGFHLKKTVQDSKFGKNLIKILGTLHEGLNNFILFAIEIGKQNRQLVSGILGRSSCHEIRLLTTSCLFLPPSACNSAAPTSGISVKLHIDDVFENLWRHPNIW